MRVRWLAAAVLSLSGVAWSQTSQPSAAPATVPTTQSAVPDDASTPRGALRQLFRATDAGDGAKIRSLLYTDNPREEKMADSTAQLSSAIVQLNKAITDAFGADAAKALFGDMAALSKERDNQVDQLVEEIHGDTAVVHLDPLGQGKFQPMDFKKVGNLWKLRVGKAMENLDPAKVDQQLEYVADQVKVMNDITADVTAGKIKTAEEATQTLQAKMRQAIMQLAEKQRKAATQSTAPTPEPAKP